MKKAIVLSIAAMLIAALSVSAGISLPSASLEASLGQKYEDNLLSDWTQIADYTSTGHFAIKLYPFANLELNGSIDRNLIRIKENTDPTADTSLINFGQDTVITWGEDLDEVLESLSTVTTGLHLTYIPTSPSSQFSLYFTGGVGRHEYDNRNTSAYDTIQYLGDTTIRKRDFKIYSTTDYDLTSAIGYQYNPRVHLRSELSFNYHNYTNSFFLKDMVNNNQIIDAVIGGNWSITGTNVLDMEFGYSDQTVNRTYVDTTTIIDTVNVQIYDVYDDGEENLKVGTFYISPRFSRQLGERTGVNFTGTYRSFVSGSDIIVAGETAELLDPFATVWEGTGLTINIKTFLIPRLITSLSFGYWDKNYLRHEELKQTEFGNYAPTPVDRDDTKKSVYLGLQMPLRKTWGGLKFEPSLGVEYSDNSSTIERYNAYGWNLSFGISLKR